MKSKIGVQLYSVRDNLKNNFEQTLTDIAAMGYDGVEFAGVPSGTTYKQAASIVKKLHLSVSSAHCGLPIGAHKNKVLDEMGLLGCTVMISGKGPDDFKTSDAIRKTCDQFNEAVQVAAENRMSFGIHNHWWEFQMCNDKPVYQVMLEHLDKRVFFEVDTYWVTTAGMNAAAVISELGQRVPFLHMKDGPCKQGVPMVAAGSGSMKFVPIIKAATSAKWCIVELDECATDMMTAVRKSREYLSSII